LALAHSWERLLEKGPVASFAEIAKLAGLSRARVSQIMTLQYLAPDNISPDRIDRYDPFLWISQDVIEAILGIPRWREIGFPGDTPV
jgi:hypothetical protein